MRIALFTKANKPTTKEAVDYLRKRLGAVTVYKGEMGDPFPKKAFRAPCDILISYLSPWIIPKKILNRTKSWNINFHPGPPAYPGIGCFNFAIYNKEKIYGITAHLMNERVDTGKIIAVKRFPLLKSDSVYSLSIKSYKHMLLVFFEIMGGILAKMKIPESNETWKRKPYTRKELEDLCKINLSMSKSEIERRIKATFYPNMPRAYIDMFNYKFEYQPDR
ncbi:MAG: hypothetical protein JSV93_04815 [Candidatus Omnitrophota bacterium]|nr:MAG: hypothetical protein JSV93_04815 [Candidatus Omnitrophota bacterium]